jgi:hypothetical protein
MLRGKDFEVKLDSGKGEGVFELEPVSDAGGRGSARYSGGDTEARS